VAEKSDAPRVDAFGGKFRDACEHTEGRVPGCTWNLLDHQPSAFDLEQDEISVRPAHIDAQTVGRGCAHLWFVADARWLEAQDLWRRMASALFDLERGLAKLLITLDDSRFQ